jgi:cellulose synthase/poly-beta-1,6-N-acetylglucosamine synthase-like glycosyltransferase
LTSTQDTYITPGKKTAIGPVEIAFSGLLLWYLIFLFFVRWRWNKIPHLEVAENTLDATGVSIVIPVRNEQHNIEDLISSINSTLYPQQNLQIVIVDDASEDGTLARLRHLAASQSNLVYISLSDPPDFQGSYKKRALTKGIELAKFPIIVTTDADCRFQPNWINALVSCVQLNQWVMATGPVVYNSSKWFTPILNMELACLVAVGAVSLDYGAPNMCNGANLVFSKEKFLTIGGYSGFEQIVSGDDEFLLYKMNAQYPGRVGFVKSQQAVVETDPPISLTGLLDQRKRWASKWKAHKSISTQLLALLIFGFHLLFTTVIVLTLLGLYPWKLLLLQLVLKMIFEHLLVAPVLNFLGKRLRFQWFLFTQLVYSIYVVFIGIAAHLGSFNWKNRQYS